MNELIDIKPDIDVKEDEYKRLLGYPHNYELEGRARELADWARLWYSENGKPWVYSTPSEGIYISDEKLEVDGVEFSSLKLRNQFAEAEAYTAMLTIVSAGKELEEKARQLWEEEKPDEYFFLEIFGSAVVEHLITYAGARFCAWADNNGSVVLPHYSPGYTGWIIEDQKNLLQLIMQKKTINLPGEIQVYDTGMLKPKKSMLALFGIAKNTGRFNGTKELIPCKTCALQNCQYRRSVYKYSRTLIEDVNRMQGNNNDLISPKEKGNGNGFKPVLNQNAKYTVSLKALEKWSKEKLQVKILDDNSVEAKFRYEGTTCSNMGRALQFNHNIKLSSAKDGYKITELNCIPAEGDTGHTYMCKFITDADTLMDEIYNEKPLLGKPLNDILTWKREFSPEGCYCEHESREHKWGLALEVLHFALAKYENGKINSNNTEDKILEYKL